MYLALLGLWTAAQAANMSTHLTLANLRPKGTTTRGIPKGFGFNLVTCPNYLFELVTWMCMWGISGGNWAVGLFVAVAGTTMAMWAGKKERRYRKEFGGKYRAKRWVIVPGVW